MAALATPSNARGMLEHHLDRRLPGLHFRHRRLCSPCSLRAAAAGKPSTASPCRTVRTTACKGIASEKFNPFDSVRHHARRCDGPRDGGSDRHQLGQRRRFRQGDQGRG